MVDLKYSNIEKRKSNEFKQIFLSQQRGRMPKVKIIKGFTYMLPKMLALCLAQQYTQLLAG